MFRILLDPPEGEPGNYLSSGIIPAGSPPPTTPPAGPEGTWHVGAAGETCTATCLAAGNLGCSDGDWGADHDEWSEAVVAMNDRLTCGEYGTPNVPGGVLPFLRIPSSGAGVAACSEATTPSVCNTALPDSLTEAAYARLCKCNTAAGTAAGTTAPPPTPPRGAPPTQAVTYANCGLLFNSPGFRCPVRRPNPAQARKAPRDSGTVVDVEFCCNP
jgi:hypothetical protein